MSINNNNFKFSAYCGENKNINYGYGDNENFDLIMKLDSNTIEQLESLFKHKKGR